MKHLHITVECTLGLRLIHVILGHHTSTCLGCICGACDQFALARQSHSRCMQCLVNILLIGSQCDQLPRQLQLLHAARQPVPFLSSSAASLHILFSSRRQHLDPAFPFLHRRRMHSNEVAIRDARNRHCAKSPTVCRTSPQCNADHWRFAEYNLSFNPHPPRVNTLPLRITHWTQIVVSVLGGSHPSEEKVNDKSRTKEKHKITIHSQKEKRENN